VIGFMSSAFMRFLWGVCVELVAGFQKLGLCEEFRCFSS
jgi:hypothetical protein